MEFRPDIHSHTPLYLQLEKALRDVLARGEWRASQALPPERELAETLGVSRITVRKALERLEVDGLLIRRQGSGTFVAPTVEQPLSLLSGFSRDMEARGLIPSSRWVQQNLSMPTPTEALTLGVSPNGRVARLERVRLASGEPMALELATLPASIVPEPTEVGDSLYGFLEAAGRMPVRALQRMRALPAAQREAELLGIAPGAPVLFIQRVAYLEDGVVVEFTRSHYRGDRYDFITELRGG